MIGYDRNGKNGQRKTCHIESDLSAYLAAFVWLVGGVFCAAKDPTQPAEPGGARSQITFFDEPVGGSQGVPQGYCIDEFDDEGLMFEGVHMPPGFTALGALSVTLPIHSHHGSPILPSAECTVRPSYASTTFTL